MYFYQKQGEIPRKPHTKFHKKDGESLYREELCGLKGFSGVFSNKYHIFEPTRTISLKEISAKSDPEWSDAPLNYYHFSTNKKKSGGDFVTARDTYLFNPHCSISAAHVNYRAEYYFKNAGAHELIFIHHGSGSFLSEYGRFEFVPGDQIVIPRGTIYQMHFDNFENNKLIVIESDTPFEIPSHYRNESGQIMEQAPFCERDFKLIELAPPHDEEIEATVIIKNGDRFFEQIVDHHPFDLIGWDGFLYPVAINIKDFNPVVGKIHLPPPVHLLFTTAHFVYCNFVPRLFDFHPDAIPAPYFHSNVDSDEVLYYVEGNFMSRDGISDGSMTMHPGGLTHGPQPGKTEESIGKNETAEYALMIDTFAPLSLTVNVKDSLDKEYPQSWLPTR